MAQPHSPQVIDRRRAEMPLYSALLRLFLNQQMLLRRYGKYDETLDANIECVQAAVRFRIDNIATWTYQNLLPGLDSSGALPLNEVMARLPNIAPIGEYVWFEFESKPYRINSPGAVAKGTDQGCLVRILADKEQPERLLPQTIERLAQIEDTLGKPVRWLLETEDYMLGAGRDEFGVYLPDWIPMIAVSPDGVFLASYARPNPLVEEPAPEGQYRIAEETLCALAALTFLHAKNVKTTDHVPPRAVRRQAAKDGRPVVTFKTLDIEIPARAVREAQGHYGGSALEAMHLVRGSFAHYGLPGPDGRVRGKLFGQHTGMVYRPMHTRGSPEAGVVAKDYQTRGTPDAPNTEV